MKYRTIVADPPWTLSSGGGWTGAGGGWAAYNGLKTGLPYPSMVVPDIAALPVAGLAEDDAHLYLWTVNAHIEDAYDIARGWGFLPSTLLTWCKEPMGMGLGGAYVQTTEHILFARRGALRETERIDSTWWKWKRGRHSVKPEAFLDMVESVSPGPYLELFARRNRFNWDTWGNESLEHVELG